MTKSENSPAFGVVVMAAGKGKRMRSSLPKVLNEIGGKPLIFHVLSRIQEVDPKISVALVVGHGREAVEKYVRGEDALRKMSIHFVTQEEQLGTGHAVRCAVESEWGVSLGNKSVLVLPGDTPLIASEMIRQMTVPLKKSETVRLLSTEMDNPTGYGRVVRKGASVLKIVEEKDALLKEKAIREVVASIYFYESKFLKKGLTQLSNKNAQKEYYLTDLIDYSVRIRKKVSGLLWTQPEDLLGINDPWELAQVNQLFYQRRNRYWALQGVRFLDPVTPRIDAAVHIEDSAVIHPYTTLMGKTRIGQGAVIGPYVSLQDVEVGKEAVIKQGSIAAQSQIGSSAQIGPYAHLRPESVVADHVKIGNFVELKKTRIGKNTSVAHLSYLGDAEVGENVNIGCGFVTCNFDGRVINGQRKHRTIIEDDVFMGSDCQTVAPVRVGKGSFVASGSTITEEVPPGSLAIARAKQVTKPGYASKLKKES